jgi:hypothetical protein
MVTQADRDVKGVQGLRGQSGSVGWPRCVGRWSGCAISESPGFFGEFWLESTASVPRRDLANRGEETEEPERTTPAETFKCLGNASGKK